VGDGDEMKGEVGGASWLFSAKVAIGSRDDWSQVDILRCVFLTKTSKKYFRFE